jgi:homocysteine S-methyltransferase
MAVLTNTPTESRSRTWKGSTGDGEHISDGTPITECVADLASIDRVVAVGVNCTAPVHITSLVEEIGAVTDIPIVVYPNSGEVWDADRKSWTGAADPIAFALAGRGWYGAGARLLGGCCRTRPEEILRLRESLGS